MILVTLALLASSSVIWVYPVASPQLELRYWPQPSTKSLRTVPLECTGEREPSVFIAHLSAKPVVKELAAKLPRAITAPPKPFEGCQFPQLMCNPENFVSGRGPQSRQSDP